MKFKTLKDIGTNIRFSSTSSPDYGMHVLREGIKEEAKKQLDYKFAMALNAPDRGTKEFLLGQCAFIEEFFDIDGDDVVHAVRETGGKDESK